MSPLANYVYYREQEYTQKRSLQTHGSLEYDLGNDEEEEAAFIDEESKLDPDSDSEKVSLFRKIEKFRFRAALHRKYYSYYRVIQAAIESFTVVNVLILVILVCTRSNRKINLSKGVEGKLSDFLGFDLGDQSQNQTSILDQLGLVRDVTFAISILYSMIMVTSALVR